jgi:hypothetical protein
VVCNFSRLDAARHHQVCNEVAPADQKIRQMRRVPDMIRPLPAVGLHDQTAVKPDEFIGIIEARTRAIIFAAYVQCCA